MGKKRRKRRNEEQVRQQFADALDESDYLERAVEEQRTSPALPEPLGFSESFEHYLVRCGLRLPFRDDEHRYQNPDCSCRGRRDHWRHDADCLVGMAYRRWDEFMRDRWDYVRAWHEEREAS